jgi:DNA-binding transcriptional MerR regulator/ubiquinone/menaquinone biosynthesis C-methylase UbiE
MRIGKFAKMNDISVDAIRHYMDLGLIVPEKKGGQYDFDDRCQGDLKLIMEFKAMGFHLNEIKTFFLYKNFGKFIDYEGDSFYQSLFKEKHQKIEQEITYLTEIKDKLQQKLNEISAKSLVSATEMGMDIGLLNFLQCSKCGEKLMLLDGKISNNQIIEGRLACGGCGEGSLIETGILTVNKQCEITSDLQIEHQFNDYIQLTDLAYLENMNVGLQWSKRKLEQLDLHKKVILELGSGIGFFLRNIYMDLPEDCLYVAVDHDLERHRILKSLLERTKMKRNILFICADFREIPIPKQSIDIIIDHSGTSNYSFEHDEFLLKFINPFVKPDGHILGSYFVFKNFSPHSKIAPQFRDNFILKKIKNHIMSLNYNAIDERTSEVIDKGGKFEDFFVTGEEVFTYSFFGKRLG